MYEPIRGGTRGGHAEFKWSDVSADKDRENYIGHSINAPTGRWQKNKDVHWYSRDVSQSEMERMEEIRKIKEAEEDAIAVALGFKPTVRPNGDLPSNTTGPNDIPLGVSTSQVDAVDVEKKERKEKKEKKEKKKEKSKRHKEHRTKDRRRHIADVEESSVHDRRYRSRSLSASSPHRRRSHSRSRSPHRHRNRSASPHDKRDNRVREDYRRHRESPPRWRRDRDDGSANIHVAHSRRYRVE